MWSGCDEIRWLRNGCEEDRWEDEVNSSVEIDWGKNKKEDEKKKKKKGSFKYTLLMMFMLFGSLC